MDIKILDKTIGLKHPTYFIADIAANHDGDLERAKTLIRLAKERGLKGFTAKVLQTNKGMMQVFENGHLPINARLRNGIYSLTIPFKQPASRTKNNHDKF